MNIETANNVLLALVLLGVTNALRTPPFVVRPHIASRLKSALTRKSQVFDNVPSAHELFSSMTAFNFQGKTFMTLKQSALMERKSLHEFFSLPQSAPIILCGSKNNRIREIEYIDTTTKWTI